MKERLKCWLFGLLGKEPDAAVVCFASGPSELADAMFAEIQALTPGRRHFLIRREEFPDAGSIKRFLRPYRIGLAPVLLTGEPEYEWMRWAAFRLAPLRILAYNQRLERHHLTPGSWIASVLFLRGVPLDRIFLRPWWLVPWKKDRSEYPRGYEKYDGKPFTSGRRRVALVCPYFPFPLAHGGAVRMFSLIREIASHFDVVLISFTDQEFTEVDPLLPFCSHVYVVKKPRYREPRWSSFEPPEVAEFRSPTMQALLARVQAELAIDVVQVEYTMLAPYAGDILVEHDVTFQLYRQVRERDRTVSARWNHWRWLRFEKRWIGRYPRVVTMSEEDREVLDQPNVEVIPNGVDLLRFVPEHERPGERLLFIGSFRHFPNIVAYRFFVDQVWPLLRETRPGIRLTVVAGPDPELHWREHTGLPSIPRDAGIDVHGFVREVRPLYIEANLVLAPTLVSAGTNLKVLEALAMERAVVSTTSGCAGLGLRHGETVWIADDPEEMAAGIAMLLGDRDRRRQIAEAGRRHAERHFDWRQIGLRQRALIRRAMAIPATQRPATDGDLDAICAIQDTSPEASQWLREDYLSFDCAVAEWDGAVVGFHVGREVGPGEREILNVAVDPEYRRSGIARSLIQAELRRHPGTHFLEVRTSNEAARTLYRGLGFAEVGLRPGYYENPPEPGIVMRIRS